MDKYEVLIPLVIGIALLFLIWQIAPIFAQEVSRDDIRTLRDQIDEARINYGKADNHIISQRNKIVENENLLKEAEELLEQYENSLTSSWDAIQGIDEARVNVDLAKQRLDDSRAFLLSLQQEKEKWLLERNSLESQLEKKDALYIEQNQPDLEGLTKLVGVRLSQNCILMIKNNITNDCPTYEQLEQLDSSNTEISGEFKFFDGYYHREHSRYKHEYAWYHHDDELRIIVDPSVAHMGRIKMITLENNFNIFLQYPDFKVINNTVTYHKDRSVHSACRDAQISASKWLELLPDTIYYLRTQCTETNFDNTVVNVRDDTYWNPEDSPGWQYRQWVAAAKILCLGLC